MAESVDDFLRKVSEERKTLTDQEKKDAMEVASEIRKKVEEIAKGKDKAAVSMRTGEQWPYLSQFIFIYSGEANSYYNDRNPNADLVIVVDPVKYEEERRIQLPKQEYYFTPHEVIKTITDPGISATEASGRLKQVLGKGEGIRGVEAELDRIEELRTEETYHPNKADLSNLLANLSSSTPVRLY